MKFDNYTVAVFCSFVIPGLLWAVGLALEMHEAAAKIDKDMMDLNHRPSTPPPPQPVGEAGPEKFVPFLSSRVTPSHPTSCSRCGAPWEPSCSYCGTKTFPPIAMEIEFRCAPIAKANPLAENRIYK